MPPRPSPAADLMPIRVVALAFDSCVLYYHSQCTHSFPLSRKDKYRGQLPVQCRLVGMYYVLCTIAASVLTLSLSAEKKSTGDDCRSSVVWLGLWKSEKYRDYTRPPSLQCCARNILTVLRETLTQYILFNRGGRGESVLLYSVVLQPWYSASTPLCR